MKIRITSLPAWKPLTIAAAALLGLTNIANAEFDIYFDYNAGTNTTTAVYSGTWNVSNNAIDINYTPSLGVGADFFLANPPGSFAFGYFGVDTGTWPISSTTGATASAGDVFGFSPLNIYGPDTGFAPTTYIHGSLIFAGSSFTDLGITPGTSGTISGSGGVVNWSVSAVPEPSTYTLIFGCGALALGLVRRRRR